MNRVALSARIASIGSMRYTPAGLPALDFQLEHESEVEEAGQTRQVSVVIRAVTFGSQAESLGRQTIGSLWRFSGFLAAARGGKGVVLHVQQFQSADRPGDPT